ncbi:MAG: beta-ketoacyl-ACP synthase II [Dehalococcoidia bacterium]|nr:beta-ketoacyl-[acyl-carrier-protein] synthase II [Chloroflexi bacterium CFX7]MCK6563951.1 beta-ketoacyl-ACP synthase II [Dehalococcoidia bacterium]NUQ56325.1 beta-ketoacyl-ACP synthase II [Dehalococcoidia bacterium]
MNETLRSRRRVVITGLGAVTPAGQTVAEFWENLVNARSGIGPITLIDPAQFPCRVAGEVTDWDPSAHIERKAARRMARFTQFMVASAAQAVADAGLDLEAVDRNRAGVLVGNGGGGYPDIQEGAQTLFERGGMKLDPLYFPRSLGNMAAAQVALQYGLRGYNGTICTACAAGTQAIGEAGMVIRSGRADVMVTGGCEAGISELGLAGFSVMRALTSQNDLPEKASRPFDAARDGFVPCEGAGALILESEEHAQARGARIYAELAGFGCTSDAFHVVAPPEDGEGAARAMAEALRDSGFSPAEIGYINAHATSTPLGDTAETNAIKLVFGEGAYRIPISATKSLIGHGLGASGGMETVATVKTVETGVIHPTANLENPDPTCDLDYVPHTARQAGVRVALKNSFGFGGQNSCLVIARYEA